MDYLWTLRDLRREQSEPSHFWRWKEGSYLQRPERFVRHPPNEPNSIPRAGASARKNRARSVKAEERLTATSSSASIRAACRCDGGTRRWHGPASSPSTAKF